MPDRYDPKLTVRPPGDRRPVASDEGDDPLAELARIVTGRASFDPPPAEKGKTVPAPEEAAENDIAADLESELLNDLQASFAALGEPFGESEPAPPEGGQPTVNKAASDPVLPPAPGPVEPNVDLSPLVPGPEPEPPAAVPVEPLPLEPMATVEDVLAELQDPVEPPRQPPPEAISPSPPTPPEPASPPPVEPAEPPPVDSVEPPPAVLTRPPRQLYRQPEPPSEPPAQSEEPPVAERQPAPPRRPATRSDFSRLRLRPSRPGVAQEDDVLPAEPAVPAASRRHGADTPQRSDDRPPRLAPPRAAARVRPEPPRVPAPPSEPIEPEARPSQHVQGGDGADFPDDFSLEDLDTAAYAPEDDLPPFPEEELASLKRRRSGRAVAVIGGIFVIALAGAAAAYLMGGDTQSDEPPPVIAADSTPTKVFPDAPAATDQDQQGKLIYDRVDDTETGSETTLVTGGDDPIVDVPADDEDLANNPIARVIVPGGPGIDGPIADSGDGVGSTDAESDLPAAADASIGPKKVRTVVVRPDGTIVSSEAVEEGAAGAEGLDGADGQSSDLASVATDMRTDMDAVLEGEDVAVNPDPLGVTDPDRGLSLVPEPEPVPLVAQPEETVVATAEPAETVVNDAPSDPEPSPAPAPVETTRPDPAPAPPQNQTSGNGGPIDLAAGTVPASAAPSAGSGGVLVQVSAQRTEDAARSTYSSLQNRYPGILGPYQAAIIRADLGDRGIYYRVRIGPFSSRDASRLCEDLKAAGGECILAR
ncbi:MAG: hypothetical protein GY798_32550 [Hyphomicrobiales bacterium]|nr:hypothetical protein [Hyphomicrobiales bacterium]